MKLKIDDYRPSRYEGSKEERMEAILEPRYDNLSVWHYRGGMCQVLEEELTMGNPPHDDVKDALASAMEISTPPARNSMRNIKSKNKNVIFHPRFGGVSH
jgi:hypothetical protein